MAVEVDPVSFVVLNPDGTPASDAVALARITDGLSEDPAAGKIYQFEASRSGQVSISIPLTDPYLLRQFPKHKIFNVHVTLLKPGDTPGEGATAFGAVDYVLNLGDPRYPIDFAKMHGAVVTLVPLPATSHTDAAPAPLDDGEVCQYYDASYACTTVWHPYDTQGEQVVVAHNIGATTDMYTRFTVQGSVQIATSTVTGVDGLFIEDRGVKTLSQDWQDQYGFGSDIVGPNEDAALYVNFARVDVRHCFVYGGTCNTVTTFVPDKIIGPSALLPTSETIYHGYAQNPGPTNTDCTAQVVDFWSNSRGVSISEDWSFGFDFDGSYHVFNLHVTSVKQNTSSSDYRNTYEWTVDVKNAYFPYHHLFIRLGHLNGGSGTGSVCPTDAPQNAWTDSSFVNKDNPPPPPVAIPPTPPEAEPAREPTEKAVKERQQETGRCAAAPERCGRDY